MFKTKETDLSVLGPKPPPPKKNKSIAVKYRKHTKPREFIAAEVKRLLIKEIIEFFTSCWQAQVIETINKKWREWWLVIQRKVHYVVQEWRITKYSSTKFIVAKTWNQLIITVVNSWWRQTLHSFWRYW